MSDDEDSDGEDTATLHQILLVDDEEEAGIVVRRHLGIGYFHVVHARTMPKAREVLEGANFALIIQDLRMPPLLGVEAVEKIREHAPKTPIMVLTANRSEGMITGAIEAGASAYVLKDMLRHDPDALRHRVIEALARDRFHDPFRDAFLAMTDAQRLTIDTVQILEGSVKEHGRSTEDLATALSELISEVRDARPRSAWATITQILMPGEEGQRTDAVKRTADGAVAKLTQAILTAATLISAWFGLGGSQ